MKHAMTASLFAGAMALAACTPEQDAKTPAAPEPAAQEAKVPSPAPKYKEIESPGAAKDHAGYRQDMTEIAIAAKGDPSKGDQLEYMVRMKAGNPIVYSWEVLDGGGFWHEFHGHTEDAVTFYKKAEGTTHSGSLVAPFDGIHGWYFENRSDKPVIVRIRTSGFYEREPAKE